MRILMLSVNYAPELTGIAPLVTELAEDLAKSGHEITVVTGMPSYPRGRVEGKYKGHLKLEEKINGVRLIRTYVYARPQAKSISRVLFYFSFLASCWWGALSSGKQDLIFCVSAPFHLGLVGRAVATLKRVPYIYNIQDLLIDAAIALDKLKNPVLIKILRMTEKRIYKKAAGIAVICDRFKKHVSEFGYPPEKIAVIPNWADVDHIKPGERDNAFRSEIGLNSNQFLLMYTGNVGMQMGLEYMLEAAKLLKDDKNVVFCFVGEGSGRKALEAKVTEMKLDNVKFLPLQPRECLPEVFAAADALVASLRPEIRGVFSHPSKVWSIMASGRPVIGAFHDDTDAAHIINGAECGIIIKPGVPEEYVRAIDTLRNDPEYKKKLGANGRKYAELHYNRKIVVEQYINFFKETIK